MIPALERPILAVDIVIFTFIEKTLYFLTQRRDEAPFKGAPALPGAAVRIDETLEEVVVRVINEKIGRQEDWLRNFFVDQLAVFDGLFRDPRGRTISISFLGILKAPEASAPGSDWLKAHDAKRSPLPFDHDAMVAMALARLRGKLRYTNIAQAFLPNRFRIDALQAVYEGILAVSLNRTNFRNKLLKIGLIQQVSVENDAVGKRGGRPPHIYSFTEELLTVTQRDFC